MRLAVSGIDETKRRQLATRLRGAMLVDYPVPRTFGAQAECDAVALLGSAPTLTTVAEEWLAAKKHVFLSADACDSVNVLESLADAARQSGSQLMLANPDHYLPSWQLIREQVDSGKLGDVGLVRSHRWMPAETGRTAQTTLPAVLAGDIELVASLVGRAPHLVFATSPSPKVSNSAGRFIQVHLGFSGGAMALVDFCDRLPAGDGYQTLSLICASGAAYVDDQQNVQLLFRGGQPQAIRADEGVRPLVNLVQAFVDGLAAGRDFSDSIADWRRALSLASAAEKSLESGQPVTMEGDA